ncbi:MAG: rsmI [Clostridia bacterium]|nr:rsmI [Clostridia bacterium]
MKKISLYIVPTPIGNLSDMTFRAIEILKSVDFIAAEDTRKSGILLKHFEIKKPMLSYFEHNKAERGQIIIDRLLNGETCALISDAGMPAISDPGEMLVAQCYENNLTVSALPGPCAAVTALAMSGISTKRFCFEGFLSTAANSRKEHLSSLQKEKRTLIFYEAPHKLKGTLKDLSTYFGNRRISLVREISKIYEEVLLTSISDAIEYYKDREVYGEFVLLLEGSPEEDIKKDISEEELEKIFNEYISQGMTKSFAAKAVATRFNLLRREVYDKFKD